MKKILIIDDSALMRRVMSDIINTDSEMCVTDTAENGVAAAELLKQGKEYELILLDISMPRMDGLSFLKYLNEKEIHIPVLVVSSLASKSTEETIQALELGAYDFVKKPSRTLGKEEDFPKQLLAKAKCAFTIQQTKPVKKKEKKRGVDSRPVKKQTDGGKTTKRVQTCEFAVIASSTGGPKALQSVVPKLPKTFPCPLVIVQHMANRVLQLRWQKGWMRCLLVKFWKRKTVWKWKQEKYMLPREDTSFAWKKITERRWFFLLKKSRFEMDYALVRMFFWNPCLIHRISAFYVRY